MLSLPQFIKELNHTRDKLLTDFHGFENCTVKKYQHISDCNYNLLSDLKEFIKGYTFANLEEEIHFFKHIKPIYNSELIYANKTVQLLLKKPPGNKDTEREYYNSFLNDITSFFHTNQEFYQYYRSNSTFQDHIYFVRKNKRLTFYTENQLYNFESAFTTSHDHLVSQIIANEKLEKLIKTELDCIQFNIENPHVYYMGKIPGTDFRWTDSKSALIELIYALYAKGCINNGDLDIRQLAIFFEGVFNVKLPEIYRTFQDIKMRQNPTKFIDSLKTALDNKLEEGFRT